MGEKLGPVETTPRSEDTYNSSTLHSFTWRKRPESEDFNEGQLIVKFRNNNLDNPDQSEGVPSSAYAYNVPKEAFEELKYRAENVDRDDDEMTAGEWFNKKLDRHVKWNDKRDGNLYISKLNITR